ncbi:cilia- and flagella- associated protein 210 [Clinocottus analis]|uniref:cilia- and flagella- associated protein 210 n=1 Tax=Clinocottus analis TaxID=304258 RepID=UPI0035BF93E4
MASVVQYGRRRGSSKRGSSAEEVSRMIQPPDLQQVTVLTQSEWRRIQDELNQINKDKESMKEAAKQREALHLQSQEVVKLWSNTIAGQRQKKIESKKIREEIEEEKRKQTDQEEAKYREQQRKEANEKAQSQMFYQTDRVKGLHRALLLTEVLTEREAQIDLKQKIKNAWKDVDNNLLDMMKTREDEASRKEQEKALQKKLETQAVAEDLKHQIKKNEQVREQEKIENKKNGEEIQNLQALHLLEQRMEQERQTELKRNLMHAHMEHVTKRDLIKASDVQKQEAEEEQRKLFLSAKQKMMKLQKVKEKELFREAQIQREIVKSMLVDSQRGRSEREEQRIMKAVAEQEAKKAQRQIEEEEKRAAMLESITAHRELVRQEKEQRDRSTKQNTRDTLQAKIEADRIFSEKQKLKAQRMKEDRRRLQDFNVTLMAEKSARHQQLRREQHEFEEKNAELDAEEEKQFQQYSQHIIRAATEAKQNVFSICKAAAEGIRGGHGPISKGVKPNYLVQDLTGAQMPTYVSGATESTNKLNEAEDILEAKRKLGFMWS